MKNVFTLSFGLACAYLITGYLSNLLLAIDGYAVGSWPPAGIAVAGFLLWGQKSIVGTFIGALFTNLIHLDSASDSLNWQIFIQAMAVATTSVFQAWLGAQLITKVIKAPLDLSSLKRNTQSLLVAGPLCCIIGAAVGTSLLALNNVIPQHAVVNNFIMWWIGDSVGVVIFTPLLLAAFNYSQVRQRLQVIVPPLVIYIVICVSFYGATSAKKTQDIAQQQAKIHTVKNTIENELAEITAHLTLLATFFASSEDVQFKEFVRFTSKQLALSEEVLAFQWLPYVPHQQLSQHQALRSRTVTENYYVKQRSTTNNWQAVTVRDGYYPVQYINPLSGNNDLLGLDLAANPAINETLKQSKTLNELMISKPLQLVHGTSELAVLFFQPVFTNATSDDDFKGFVVAVVSVEKLAQTLAASQDHLVTASVVDVTTSNAPHTIYTADHSDMALLTSYQLLIGKRQWQVDLFQPRSRAAWLIYWLAQLAGMIFVWLLVTFLISVTGTNIQIGEQVAKQTRSLRREKQKADDASRIKSQFLANMSHEIRTPINGIKGLHYLALQQNDWQQARSYIEQADGALGVLLRVLNDVLDFSKMEAGKLNLIPQPVDVARLAEEIISLVQFDVSVKSLALTLEYDKSTPLVVSTDPIRLKQILLNLVNNAIKFTAHGSISVKIWQSKTSLFVSVADTGIGISSAVQEKLFIPFSQADNSTSRQYGGTGLGLSICKKLVELMGGTIAVSSGVGQGSTFTISLPLNTPLTKKQHSQASYHEGDIAALTLVGYNILLVEDNPLNQHVASAMLKTKGCITAIANNGLEAIEMLSEQSYDIVLMDIQMPKMDGLQATKVIRNELGMFDLPIIGLSANAHAADIKKAAHCGMNDYITKPIEANVLFKTVWHYLSRLEN
jgi:two-component system, sensor histidine kinase